MRFVAAFMLIFICGTTAACVMETQGLTPILVSEIRTQLERVGLASTTPPPSPHPQLTASR